jgi:hypothetical protein
VGKRSICGCRCHTGPFAACDVPGGCGSTGCGEDAGCVLCPVYRPDSDPRNPDYPPVCDGDRRLIDKHLIEIANAFADLSNPEPPVVDDRRYERYGVAYLKDNQRLTVSLGETWADPVAAVGGVGPIPSRSNQPAVSGSRERPMPILADTFDLKAPARHAEPSEHGRRYKDDQIGRMSAAEVLADVCADVRDTLFAGHHLPPVTVDEMVAWLRPRMPEVCDHHPAVADIAAELKGLRGALCAAAGTTEPKPEACTDVPCKRCDLITLFRQPGGDVACVNPDCQAVLRGDEYAAWTKTHLQERKLKQHA